MNALKTLFLSTLVLVLAGCFSILNEPTEVVLPTEEIPHDDAQWQQHLAQLKQITAFSSKGQFGFISPDERFSSHFDWQYKSPTAFSFTMSSNLSTQSLKLQRNQRGLTISDSDGNSRTERDIEGLMKEIIGVAFPIDQFAYWVKGLPESDKPYIVNEKRQLAQFHYPLNDSVWTVNYIEYHEDRQPNLPKLIVLENGKQTLKIRLTEWSF